MNFGIHCILCIPIILTSIKCVLYLIIYYILIKFKKNKELVMMKSISIHNYNFIFEILFLNFNNIIK